MSPERQRVVIAELCGFHPTPWATWTRSENGINGPFLDLPDYLNDLNAMHEAEMRLKDFQRDDFRVHLMRICGGEAAIHATGGQRAEALIRTLNKWEGA